MNRVVTGCEHSAERMTQWVSEGACPICLSVHCGLLRDTLENAKKSLEPMLQKLEEHDIEFKGLRQILVNINTTLRTVPAENKKEAT